MLRIRDTSGATEEVREEFRFLEVCDFNGRIAALVYRDDAGTVKLVEAGTAEAERYKQLFKAQKIEFCPIIHIKK
jgi:hypothetical protein